MKSLSYYLDKPGGVFSAREQEIGEPGPGELRLRTAKTSVCQSDVVIYRHGLPRIKEWPALVLHEVCAVVDAVGEYFNLTADMLTGSKRDKPIALARQVAMYIMREETQLSLSQIGMRLGKRDHKTIMHGCQKISSDINNDPELRRDVIEIRERLFSKGEKTPVT